MSTASQFPAVLDESLVGTYPARAKAGGGLVWDAVLEYRVWCYAAEGDHFVTFSTYEAALAFAGKTDGADAPLALILQEEYLEEAAPGQYTHVRERRITEWPVAFLSRPRRTPRTIPDFIDPEAPDNRLDVLRGLA